MGDYMLNTRYEELVKKDKHKQLLNMYRNILTKVSNLKQNTLHVAVTANFMSEEFNFEITVFKTNGTYTTLFIYEFWNLKTSQELVDIFILAIKTGDFEKVKAARRTALGW